MQPSFTVIASIALSLHTFIASGGIGIKTYTLLAGDESYFSVDAGSGVLSLLAGAQEGAHTVTVQAMDEGNRKVNALATVRVLAALMLSDAPMLYAIVGQEVSLHTFEADGGSGTKVFTIVAGNDDKYFTIDADSGVLSVQG